MQIQKSTLNKFFIVLGILIIATPLLLIGMSNSNKSEDVKDSNEIVIEGDKQILNLLARGGYSPKVVNAKADMPAILKVETKSTFDCSSAFTIPELKISENLPMTGITEIEIPAQKAGTVIDGTCSMGMYSFKIKFS